MRKETSFAQDSTIGITPSAPWRVCELRYVENYKFYVKFIDDLAGYIDLSQLIGSKNAGVFSALRADDVLKKAFIKYGVVTWPGELDLAPDAMYDAIKEKGIWILDA